MHSLMANTHLSSAASIFFSEAMERCPAVLREREVHWQIKMLSCFAAERNFFETCLSTESTELLEALPLLKPSQLPSGHAVPLKTFGQHHREGWPNIVSFLSQIFLQQIFS